MATHVPQRELRNNPSAVLDRVRRGEELTITVRGRPVADLVPSRAAVQPTHQPHRDFIAGLRGLLVADDRLAEELREHDEAAEDPFQRWR